MAAMSHVDVIQERAVEEGPKDLQVFCKDEVPGGKVGFSTDVQ